MKHKLHRSCARPGCALSARRINHMLAGLALLFAAGCGTDLSGTTVTSSNLVLDDCSALSDTAREVPATDRIILDFTGGWSLIYSKARVQGTQLSDFPLADGGTLGDYAEAFKLDVRDQIALTLCESGLIGIQVRVGEADSGEGVNVVHFTQTPLDSESRQMGQAEYDPCNNYHDNGALVFTDQFLRYADGRTYDEWVSVFANVAAHEIGHTLGLGHISRSENPPSEDAEVVELMLDGHTFEELCSEQRVLAVQDTCPSEDDAELAATID